MNNPLRFLLPIFFGFMAEAFATAQQPKADESIAFFRDGVIPKINIEISEAELKKLKEKDREYVRCKVTENDKTVYPGVGIHLKGAAGSFRGIEDRPALTLGFDKFTSKQLFHGLNKIHLNNSVQDPTYSHELLCSELFLAAQVPTPRVTHARVWLNGKDLGFYVLKEGFNRQFLQRHFENAEGNLYDGGFLQDIDAPLKKQSGNGPNDHADLKALVVACREPDLKKRWEMMDQLIDIDRFITFMALELITCHWDGYCPNRNNYRVYFDPKTKKAFFFPHGMDQMFGDPNYNILAMPGAIVSGTIMGNPKWRELFRERVRQLLPKFVPADVLIKRTEEIKKHIRPILAGMNEQSARELDQHVKEFQDRLRARAVSLKEQDKIVEPKPIQFDKGNQFIITAWEAKSETHDAVHVRNEKLLSIRCGPSGECIASWRSTVLLPPGTYQFEAQAKGVDIKPRQDDSGAGAGVRISGIGRKEKLVGTSDGQLLKFAFQIDQPIQEVVLVAELRAKAGEVSFELGSMRLVKLK